jgi:hypothetical protein
MGRTFNTRYKEHTYNIKSNNSNTGYSKRVLNTGHAYGTMEENMDVVRIGRKGQYLNTLEKYYIYKISREKLHMNDTNIENTIPYLKNYKKFTTHPLPTPLIPPPQHSHGMYIYRRYHAAHTHNS